jgi:transcriptional regulator, fur family
MINTSLANELRGLGLRATPQRVAVYKYLKEHRTHPTADEIFKAVVKAHPSFSRTTVYNTLKFLVEHGLALEVTIDPDKLRFDGDVKRHGHFLCDCCKKVYDFELPADLAVGIKGFAIRQCDVYLNGVCNACNLKNSNKKGKKDNEKMGM